MEAKQRKEESSALPVGERSKVEEELTEYLETMVTGSKQTNEYFLRHFGLSKKAALKYNIMRLDKLMEKL